MGSSGQSNNGMDQFYRQTIEALVAAASEQDSTAEGHSQRVRQYATAIAEAMGGMSLEELSNLSYAASLHDIGKVSVSSQIINKLGRLSDTEVQVMRQHSVVAARILEKIDGLAASIPMIKHHHEHYDGTGYPDGLEGDEIPLGARIIAVAETYDILTSKVPWRKVMSNDEAIEEIERCSGTQFDPKVVRALGCALKHLNSELPS